MIAIYINWPPGVWQVSTHALTHARTQASTHTHTHMHARIRMTGPYDANKYRRTPVKCSILYKRVLCQLVDRVSTQ